jgi:hypothetical protein
MRERRVGLLLRIPESLKKRLTDVAKREHRSVNQQIEFLLEQSLAGERKTSTIEPRPGQARDRGNR